MACPLCGSSRSSLVQKEPASPDPTRSAAYTQRTISVLACSDCSFVYVERDFPESYVNGYYEERAGGGYGLSQENFFWWHDAVMQVTGTGLNLVGIARKRATTD